MISISLCMIVKDEEEVLGRALESIQGVADEIIIVDTGSTDKTKEIAAKYTDQVLDFEWIEDFSAARNFSFSKATKDYLLWLDADDVILGADRAKFLELKKNLPGDTDVVMMKYNMSFDERGVPAFSYYRERLLSRRGNFKWVEPIHEVIVPAGNILYSDVAISHKKEKASDPTRNIAIMEKLIAQGKSLSPRLKFYYARELSYQDRLQESAAMFENFLESDGSWWVNCIDACYDVAGVYQKIGEPRKALAALLSSFRYAAPRAEICCAIGLHFLNAGDPKTAIFWYELALSLENPGQSGGFHFPECYGYIPSLQLCLCYDRIGEREKAVYYNEKAAEYKPEDSSVAYNRKYFASLS